MIVRTVFHVLTFLAVAQCLEHCSDGSFCPAGNTCCAGGCLPSTLGKWNGTCCQDGITGCGVGYACVDDIKNGLDGQVCVATADAKDPLLQRLPRYTLCRPSGDTMEAVHGYPVFDAVNKLAYYSSHGDIEEHNLDEVDHVLISMHGAARNADQFFCAASAAVKLQTIYRNVLVIAPYFASVRDAPLVLQEGGTALRWEEDLDGPWRFGARSVHPIRVSSFDAMDKFVQTILARTSSWKPLVTIFGHSSGGQFVQRWTLLTGVESYRLRAVVANPSSYAYLTPLRKIQGQWQLPPDEATCPQYNEWSWGLEDSARLDDGYKRRAMKNTTIEFIVDRYRSRHVTYMIGNLDRCNVSESETGWCGSDGLETTCMDELQGSMRFERHFRYSESLQMVGIDVHHHPHIVVDGVGHDHSLMMQQPESISVIFPRRFNNDEKGIEFE